MNADTTSNRRTRPAIDSLALEDFETSSIRSAAPSYISDAPSYHSTVPINDPTPAYFPPTPAAAAPSSSSSSASSASLATPATLSAPALAPASAPASAPPPPRRYGLPPVPTSPPRALVVDPALAAFRIPSWSSLSANPTARQYQNVAHRRSTQASASSLGWVKRVVLERIGEEDGLGGSSSVGVGAGVGVGTGGRGGGDGNDDEEGQVRRPLEDPYLVGEEAAARARRERLARENGHDILIREDMRWNFLLTQMNDWEKRQRSWTRFRRQVDSHAVSRGRLARRLIGRW